MSMSPRVKSYKAVGSIIRKWENIEERMMWHCDLVDLVFRDKSITKDQLEREMLRIAATLNLLCTIASEIKDAKIVASTEDRRFLNKLNKINKRYKEALNAAYTCLRPPGQVVQ